MLLLLVHIEVQCVSGHRLETAQAPLSPRGLAWRF